MAVSVAGKFVSALCTMRGTTGRCLNSGCVQSCMILQARNYAARKGTREKARKKKVKVIVEKVGFIPHKDRIDKNTVVNLKDVREDDSWKQDPPSDDVWLGKYYKWKIYPLAEAIQCHKETHSMGMYDIPNGFIRAKIELDMTGHRPSRPVPKFSRLVSVPHTFDHGEKRNVAVFCKTPEMQEEAKKAGATIVGGPELIGQIQTGDISIAEYDFVIAHPNIMAELLVIKGLLKKKFPHPAAGTLGIDISDMVTKIVNGVNCSGHPHERYRLYGTAQVDFGRLDMDTKHLEENFATIIEHINSFRPKRAGDFITRIRITTQLERELLKIDHGLYRVGEKKDEDDNDDDEEDDDDEPVAAAV